MSRIDEAFRFYQRHIYDADKIALLSTYTLKVAGSVPSVLWELFGAVLTGQTSQGVTGADLRGWEVKSAKMGASYEYQYHLNTGANKLEEDMTVNHLFFSYSETYEDVTVRAMPGSALRAYFIQWKPLYEQNYNRSATNKERRQRFRKSIPFGFIQKNGELVLSIENKILTQRDDTLIPRLNESLS